VRINAHARRFHEREPKANSKDGREFTHYGSNDVGCEFMRVNGMSAGHEQGVWAALVGRDKRRWVGRFCDGQWSLFELPKLERKTLRDSKVIKTEWWEPTPLCVAETSPGRLLVGVENAVSPAGLFTLEWSGKTFEKVAGVEHPVRSVQRAQDGSV